MAEITVDDISRALREAAQTTREDLIRRHPNPHPELVRACEQFWEYRERWERAVRQESSRQTATEAVLRQQELARLNEIADRRRESILQRDIQEARERYFNSLRGQLTTVTEEQARHDAIANNWNRLRALEAQQRQPYAGYPEQEMAVRAQQWEAEMQALLAANPARQRARALLISCLDTQQKTDFEQSGWFVVKKEGREYLFHQGGVRERTTNRYLCIVFEAQYRDLPVEDMQLAQLLCLQADEQTFVDLATGRERRANPAPRPQPTRWWKSWATRGIKRMRARRAVVRG